MRGVRNGSGRHHFQGVVAELCCVRTIGCKDYWEWGFVEARLDRDGDPMDDDARPADPGRRVRRNVRGATIRYPSPPPVRADIPVAVRIITEFATNQGATGARRRCCVALLHPGYLLALPLPPGCTEFDRDNVEPRTLRYLFRRHLASLLGWRIRRNEGEPHGFTEAVNSVLRDHVFPDQ